MNSRYSEEICFVARHFDEFSGPDLGDLSSLTLYDILSKSSLRLSSEDSLLKFIPKRISRDSRFFLLEVVRFEFVSNGSMKLF
jgi:hypothetical protein